MKLLKMSGACLTIAMVAALRAIAIQSIKPTAMPNGAIPRYDPQTKFARYQGDQALSFHLVDMSRSQIEKNPFTVRKLLRAFVVEQSGTIAEQSIRSTWRKITAHGFGDQIRTVLPSQGYSFSRSDRTSCFDVSKDAYITYAEHKGIKGVLIVWRNGGIEFKKVALPVKSIRFHESGSLVAIETESSQSTTQTMLCQARSGLPKLDNFRGLVIGANSTCAVVAQGNSTMVRSVGYGPKAEANRLNIEKMLIRRANAVGKITGINTPPDVFSRLTFSSNSHYMFDATVDSNETMKSVPLSDVSGLFNTRGEIWEFRSDGQLTDAFFVDSENFVFKIGDKFEMGPPGKLKRYASGLYILNCRTKKARWSTLTTVKERVGLAGSTTLDASGL